ncbi:MAG: hypothetical protein NC093_07115 [Alistipes sp.]|nr:hypothetical protein [Alistipes sp.]
MEKNFVTEQNIIEILDSLYDNEEAIYIPQTVAALPNICNDTKYIFGVAFCECLRKISMEKHFIQQAVDMIKNYLGNIEAQTVMNYVECSLQRAVEIKEELLAAADDEILRKCFNEGFISLIETTSLEDIYLTNIMSKVEALPLWKRRMVKSDIINMIEENYSISE